MRQEPNVFPETDVIVRANVVENESKLYRAGAEYVPKISALSGRLLASVLIEAQEVVSPGTKVGVVRTNAPGLENQTLADAAIRERTGATIVAVEHDGETDINIGGDFTVRGDDTLIVAGDDEAVNDLLRVARE